MDLLAERACQRLVIDYARWLDAGDAERFGALFSDDAVWDMPGWFRLEGRDAIVDRMVRPDRPGTSRHLVSNIAIDLVGHDRAVGFACFVNYRNESAVDRPGPAGEPRFVGRYLDRFDRTDDGWRIAHRRVEVDFAAG